MLVGEVNAHYVGKEGVILCRTYRQEFLWCGADTKECGHLNENGEVEVGNRSVLHGLKPFYGIGAIVEYTRRSGLVAKHGTQEFGKEHRE